MEPLQFSFVPTAEDYVRSVRAFYLRQRTYQLLLGVATLLSLWALVTQLIGGFRPYLLVSLLFLPFLLLNLFVIPALTLRRQFSRNERMRQETSWEVDDTTIVVRQPTLESRMDWGTFRSVIELPEYFLLVQAANENMFQILPRRAFASTNDEARFRELLQHHLPG